MNTEPLLVLSKLVDLFLVL